MLINEIVRSLISGGIVECLMAVRKTDKMGKSRNDLTDLLKWEIALIRESSSGNSVRKKGLMSVFCGRQ